MTGVRGTAEGVESGDMHPETLEGFPNQEHRTHKGGLSAGTTAMGFRKKRYAAECNAPRSATKISSVKTLVGTEDRSHKLEVK